MSTVFNVSARYALRSLLRNLGRTSLSILGVGLGVGFGLIALSFIGGADTMTINAAAGGGIGHLRLAPAGWIESQDVDLRLESGPEVLEAIRETPGVRVASPRARIGTLLGLGTRSAHVPLTGVDPTSEPGTLLYVRDIPEGRYLEPDDEGAIVIGRAIARRLDAALDDELVATALDDEGQMVSMLLTVVGIAETGVREVDATIAHVVLADVERLSGLDGFAEITIIADTVPAIDGLRDRLDAELAHGTDEMLTWADVAPGLKQNIESKTGFYNVAIVVILLVVLLGVASAQLTGVLERRKEFAVLAAVGMRRWQLIRVVLTEGFAIGLGAAFLALAWAGPICWRMATYGIDLSGAYDSEEGFAFGGVLIEPIIFSAFGGWVVGAALLMSLAATVLASIYPAWFAAKTDPATALRVDR
jgi:ABC-type lipoprotein release transport system permease subunit